MIYALVRKINRRVNHLWQEEEPRTLCGLKILDEEWLPTTDWHRWPTCKNCYRVINKRVARPRGGST